MKQVQRFGFEVYTFLEAIVAAIVKTNYNCIFENKNTSRCIAVLY